MFYPQKNEVIILTVISHIFFRVYNAQFELRTFCEPLSNGLVDNNKRQLNRFRLTLLGTQYDTWSQNNSSITIENSKDCKATQQYQCSSLPKQTHTYHYGHHSEIEKLQKILFAHWFITREKTHSDVYDELDNYLN